MLCVTRHMSISRSQGGTSCLQIAVWVMKASRSPGSARLQLQSHWKCQEIGFRVLFGSMSSFGFMRMYLDINLETLKFLNWGFRRLGLRVSGSGFRALNPNP